MIPFSHTRIQSLHAKSALSGTGAPRDPLVCAGECTRYRAVVRTFRGTSALTEDRLTTALAPALTRDGLIDAPSFFHGFAAHPQVLARGLVTLADVTATRYFQHAPTTFRDPVLTAHGDRLRAECFSACNGVYARLDLLGDAFDSGELGHGTTNVDIGADLRSALSNLPPTALLHLDIGIDGLTASTPESTTSERPVQMPDRWVRALGNVAELHHDLVPLLTLDAAESRAFIGGLPPVTGKEQTGWLTRVRGTVRLAPRPAGPGLHLAGLHRLTAFKRLLTNVRGMTFSGVAQPHPGPVVVAADLPGARLTLGLTVETWRGYSGEGALLPSLAGATVTLDADLVSALLAFEPVIDVAQLAANAGLSPERVRAALAVLASSGRVGWDVHEGAYFHRELPDNPDRVTKDNPRLAAARTLVTANAVVAQPGSRTTWTVRSSGGDHQVRLCDTALDEADPTHGARCTCTWYLSHGGNRGPCKHVLAVQLVLGGSR